MDDSGSKTDQIKFTKEPKVAALKTEQTPQLQVHFRMQESKGSEWLDFC